MSSTLTGLRAWILQRVTAIYLGLFFAYLVLQFTWAPPDTYEDWQMWLRSPGVAVWWALFFVALLLHAWVGIRDVLLDYVSHTALRLVLLVSVAVVLLAQGLWAFGILFGAAA